MWWGLRGLLWRAKARRMLIARGWLPGAAVGEAHLAWDFAREAMDEWGGPLMGPATVMEMDLRAYREPEAAGAAAVALSAAFRDVLAERRRHGDEEGFDHERDDEHPAGELARAGAAYALWDATPERVKQRWADQIGDGGAACPDFWPWARRWWKPKRRRRNLVRAAALIIAEIDKLDRAAGVNV